MENFRIDFTLSNPFPDGKKLGECGEKNAVQLIITPPENLASREEIRSYVVAFSTEKGPVRIGPFPKTATLTVPVRNALTVGSALSVQLEGYDSDGEFIIKSPVLSGILISNSIRDCSCSDGSESDSVFIPGHAHDNLEILDSLSDENGILKYNGKDISSKRIIRTVELAPNEFLAFADSPIEKSFIILSASDSEGNPFVPEGAEIVSIEMSIVSEGNPVWTDLREMNNSLSPSVYFINSHKAYYSEVFGATVLAIVCFHGNVNEFFDAITNYSLSGVRVKYYDESGEAE